jgi:hypothetical protein
MKRKFKTWLALVASIFPSAFSPYWRALPIGRMRMLLTGTFLIFSAAGFAVDLLQLNASRLGRGFFWPIFFGAIATAALAAAIKRVRLLPLLYLLFAVIGWLGYRAAHGSTPFAVPDALRQRVLFDAIGILVGLGLGSRLVTFFAGTEGLVSMRMQTELALAHGIQETLVPAISFQSPSFEIYGKSIPSAEMGGDLIDIVQSDGTLLAYVADISGHGLAAGQLMGMLKTAMRLAVQFGEEPIAMLESTDCVLAALSEPSMFATLALLHFEGKGQAEYASAGHVPILHYRDHSRDTVQLRLEQLPLGLIPGRAYTTQRFTYSARDLFLLVTDGITEVTNETDEEFGLTRLEELLIQHANRPLPEIGDSIMAEVKRHGVQQDDQSLLLVRVRDMAAPGER